MVEIPSLPCLYVKSTIPIGRMQDKNDKIVYFIDILFDVNNLKSFAFS